MRLPTAMRRSSRQRAMHFLRKQLELPNKHDRMMILGAKGQNVKTCIIGVKIPFAPNILKWTEAGGEKYGKDGWNCGTDQYYLWNSGI